MMYDQSPTVEERAQPFTDEHGIPTIKIRELRDGVVVESRKSLWIFARNMTDAAKLVKFVAPDALPLIDETPFAQAEFGYDMGGKLVRIVTQHTPGFSAMHQLLMIQYRYSGSIIVKLRALLFDLTG